MFSPPRILIADDEEFSSDATAEWLRQEGYICDEAHNVDAAITALATQPYALLICQLTTPGNQGLKFLRALRHNDHPVPVMVVTGHPSIQTAVGALRLGAVDYLIKPLEPQALLLRVGQVVANKCDKQTPHHLYESIQSSINALQQHPTSGAAAVSMSPESGPAWSLERYLDQTLSLLSKITTNLHVTLGALQHSSAGQGVDVCNMLNCPKAAAYETGLYDAIETIRKTKNAFKSRELGALRKRLEALLNPNLVDQTSHQPANLSGHTLLPTIEGHVSDPPQNLDR